MNIDVFCIIHNEQFLLPYFLRHYRFARKITLYDNESNDRTAEIAKGDQRVALVPWNMGGKKDNALMAAHKGQCWKGCDADYVVVCDVDEFVDCSPLEEFGVHTMAFKCIGRNMVGSDGQPLEGIRRYNPEDKQFNKVAVFSPKIKAIVYGPGCHDALVSAPVVSGLLILRHYLLLGEEYLVRRYRRNAARRSEADEKAGYGFQYCDAEAVIRGIHRHAVEVSVEEDGR